MPKVQAWEHLNDPSYSGSLTMVEFENLMLRAGYPREASHRAALQRGWQRLEAGMVV